MYSKGGEEVVSKYGIQRTDDEIDAVLNEVAG